MRNRRASSAGLLCVCESASRSELRCVINDGERVTPVKPRRPPERAADSRQNKEESLATLSHRPPHAHRNSAVCALCVFAGTYCFSELPEHRAELEGTLHCCSHHQQADRLMRLQAGGQYSLCPANKAVTWSSDAPARLREAWSVFPTRRASCTRTTPLINFTPPATLASLGLSAHLFCSGRSRFSTRCSFWKQRPRDFVEKQPTDIKNQAADQRPAGKQERGSRPEQSDRLAACRRQNETKQDDDPRLRPMRPSECTRGSQTSFKGKGKSTRPVRDTTQSEHARKKKDESAASGGFQQPPTNNVEKVTSTSPRLRST